MADAAGLCWFDYRSTAVRKFLQRHAIAHPHNAPRTALSVETHFVTFDGYGDPKRKLAKSGVRRAKEK